ncbi:MAG: hypothetical protein VB023_04800 [Oscillibacter sp.]|nr:hypothetical protein [Oscillibacter sp.]
MKSARGSETEVSPVFWAIALAITSKSASRVRHVLGRLLPQPLRGPVRVPRPQIHPAEHGVDIGQKPGLAHLHEPLLRPADGDQFALYDLMTGRQHGDGQMNDVAFQHQPGTVLRDSSRNFTAGWERIIWQLPLLPAEQ